MSSSLESLEYEFEYEFNPERGLICERRRKEGRSNNISSSSSSSSSSNDDDNDNDLITSSFIVVPLLSTTEILFKRLGYNSNSSSSPLPSPPIETDNDNDDDDDEEELHSQHDLIDIFMFALDDIRDMRHRFDEEDEEEVKGKIKKENNKKTRRSNFQIENLERQKVKLQQHQEEQKQKKTQHYQKHKHKQGGETADAATTTEQATTTTTTTTATTKEWIRIVQTYNSIRLLLDLLSNPKMFLLLNNKQQYGTSIITKNPYLLPNFIQKLTESLACLLTRTTATASSKSSSSGGGDYDYDYDCLPSTSMKDNWMKYITNVIIIQNNSQIQNNVPIQKNDSELEGDEEVIDENQNDTNIILDNSIICLTDDSSDDDDDDDNATANNPTTVEMEVAAAAVAAAAVLLEEVRNDNDTDTDTTTEKVDADGDADGDGDADNNIAVPIVPPRCYDYYCTIWNERLDEIMKELLSAMAMTMNSSNNNSSNNNNNNIPWLENAFGNLAINTARSTTNKMSVIIRSKARAKKLDERFSLIVEGRDNNNKNNNNHHNRQQEHQQYLRSIEKLRTKIEDCIRRGPKIYHDAQLEVYGSCLSGLSLGKNADVDLSLSFQDAIDKRYKFLFGGKDHQKTKNSSNNKSRMNNITAKKYNKSITEIIYSIGRRLNVRDSDFKNIETIPRARVPVIKGIYKNANNPHSIDGSLHFDICLLNDIAVANSSLIKEYSEIDSKVKSLMILIKKWTKFHSINSAQDNYLSSYTWMNLVIFYLQCIGFVPNLQCSRLMNQCVHDGFQYDPINNKKHNINNLNTSYLKWKNQAEKYWKRSNDVDEYYSSVSILLYGFFQFYANEFPYHLYMISIKRGGNSAAAGGSGAGGVDDTNNNLLPKTMFMDQSTSLSFCIEDPFETYDSHFPHDLASPLDEKGSIFINRCFHDSAKYLHRILFEDKHNDGMDMDDDVNTLWQDVKIIETRSSNEGRKRRSKRSNPDCTLLIKNLKVDDNNRNGNGNDDSNEYNDMIEQQLAKMFQPFAVQTNTNFVRTNLSRADRTLAYVDYDSIDPVLAVLKRHEKTPLVWNGNKLEIMQKSNQIKQKSTTGGRKKNKKNERKQNNKDNNGSAANDSTTSIKDINNGSKRKTLPAKGSQQQKVPSSSVGGDRSVNSRKKPLKTTEIYKEKEDKTVACRASKKKKRSNNQQSDTVGKNSGDTNNNSQSKVKGKVKGKCHSCGKSGHYVRACPNKKSFDDGKATATTITDAQHADGCGG